MNYVEKTLNQYIGQTYDLDIAEDIRLDFGISYQVYGLPKDSIITADYIPTRIRVFYDDYKTITDIMVG